MAAEVGRPAPEFNLLNQDGQQVSLGQFRGQKSVVLSFHIFDFTGG